MILLKLPHVKRAATARRSTAVLTGVATWVNAALEATVTAHLVGVRGRHWLEKPIASLASTKTVPRGRLCHVPLRHFGGRRNWEDIFSTTTRIVHDTSEAHGMYMR